MDAISSKTALELLLKKPSILTAYIFIGVVDVFEILLGVDNLYFTLRMSRICVKSDAVLPDF